MLGQFITFVLNFAKKLSLPESFVPFFFLLPPLPLISSPFFVRADYLDRRRYWSNRINESDDLYSISNLPENDDARNGYRSSQFLIHWKR